MKAALAVTASLMLACAVLQGAERGFDDIVRAVSDQLHTRPIHIPLFGLVNLATFVAHPAGVKHVEFAMFENLDLDHDSARDIAAALRNSGDHSWKPFVQVHSRTETVLVYMAQDRSDCKLLVLAFESGEASIVEVRLNPEGLQVWLNGDRRLRRLSRVSDASRD